MEQSGSNTGSMGKEATVKLLLGAPRRVVYGLLLATIVTLAAIGMLQNSTKAQVVLDQIVYLPLVQKGVVRGTIP